MKKIAASLLVCGILASNGIFAFADTPSTKIVANATIEIIKPDSDHTITTNDKIVVSGKGKEGSTVLLEVYAKKDGKFTSTQKKTFEIGPIGLFMSEVKLKPGENKIVLKSGEENKEKIVTYKTDDPKVIQKEMEEKMEKIKGTGINSIVKEITNPPTVE